jgi:hypothetical protein
MRQYLLCSLLLLPVLASCNGSDPAVNRSSIDGFEKVFAERLGKIGAVAELSKSEGGKAPVFTKEVHYSLPAAALPPGRISDVVKEILQSWGDTDVRKDMNIGGSGYHTYFDFGSGHSHVFVDVIARSDQATTFVDLLIRGIE